MTLEQFSERIKALPIGGTELLTQSQFELVFGVSNSVEERKQLAVVLAEGLSCGVRFLGLAECYAAFTKRQDRKSLNYGSRAG
jgi:hypothetical protein